MKRVPLVLTTASFTKTTLSKPLLMANIATVKMLTAMTLLRRGLPPVLKTR